MDDDLAGFMTRRSPTMAQPLLGMTVLVVEDSRFACEAMRLLCLRSGARIRRADCLKSAHRHLQTYRPSVVIVDLGLPDGSGADLITDLVRMSPRAPVILGTSGDAEGRAQAMAAGADGFLDKPIESLIAFQRVVLAALPASERPRGVLTVGEDRVKPDPLALRDDLVLAADVLAANPDARAIGYIAQFLGGVARVAHDQPLAAAAADLGQPAAGGLTGDAGAPLMRLTGIVRDRLAAGARF